MIRTCNCDQQMPQHLSDGMKFLGEYREKLTVTIPDKQFERISRFIFKLRSFLIAASQDDHAFVTLQNRGEYWVLLMGENNSPYRLINREFEAYVRPALPFIKDQYTCGWDQSDALVIMVVKRFIFPKRDNL